MPADDRIEGYAAAILEFARAEGELERVGDELFRIARTFESSDALRQALTDPRIPVERKQGVVDDLLGTKALALTKGLVAFVVAAGRATDLPEIADRVVARAAAARDRAVAEVRTAVELDPATLERLTAALSRATGKAVEAKVVLDPSVIGGVVARIGDLVIDGTVSHRLQQLRETLDKR